MKVETTDQPPKFDITKPNGIRSQTHAAEITKVLLDDGVWYNIEPGSFKFYKTSQGVPFLTFKVPVFVGPTGGSPVSGKTVELFPPRLVAVAYDQDEDVKTE